jgi:protein-tyrosine phosphatase
MTGLLPQIDLILHRPGGCAGSLFLGNEDGAASVQLMTERNIGAVLTCTISTGLRYPPHIAHYFIMCMDSEDFPIRDKFEEAIRFIDEWLPTRNVLVHCLAGASRSASIVIAYVMARHRLSFQDSYFHVKHRRPRMSPNKGFKKQLQDYEI